MKLWACLNAVGLMREMETGELVGLGICGLGTVTKAECGMTEELIIGKTGRHSRELNRMSRYCVFCYNRRLYKGYTFFFSFWVKDRLSHSSQ